MSTTFSNTMTRGLAGLHAPDGGIVLSLIPLIWQISPEKFWQNVDTISQQHLLDQDPITQYPDDREMHFYYLHINSTTAIWQKYHIGLAICTWNSSLSCVHCPLWAMMAALHGAGVGNVYLMATDRHQATCHVPRASRQIGLWLQYCSAVDIV